MSLRRTFLQRMAAMPLMSAFVPASGVAAARSRDYFSELGVRTFINAAGTYTTLTASLMPTEVTDALVSASKRYVNLMELQDKVGERIASMLGSEAAMVTSGAAGALVCGTAACVTGDNNAAILQLPDVTGLKNEVLIQKSHRYGYDHAVRAVGIKMVEIETADELSRAVSSNTAMMLFFNDADPRGQIKAADWVALGKKHKIPTFVDASADVPPVENLKRIPAMGWDLVTFSGGKGICGPQSAGILAGRKDLIRAARLNTSPYSDTIGRGLKVNKEEMVGMMVALETFIKKDHTAEWKEWERRMQTITDSVRDLPSIKTDTYVPPIANHVPHLRIKWDQAQIKMAPPEVMKKLREGTPSIEACPATNDNELVFTVWMMQPGEAAIVARRVRSVLKGA
jgi:D-glucosaminate-6-phosphate ammonia-lyase